MTSARPLEQPQLSAAPLLNKRILVVEDDYLLATDMCRGLKDLGAVVIGPAPTPSYALTLLGRRGVDAAVLDVWLHGTDVFSVAEELVARGVPIVFATAASSESIPPRYRNYPLIKKPMDPRTLHQVVERALIVPEIKDVPDTLPRRASEDPLMRAVVRALRLPQAAV